MNGPVGSGSTCKVDVTRRLVTKSAPEAAVTSMSSQFRATRDLRGVVEASAPAVSTASPTASAQISPALDRGVRTPTVTTASSAGDAAPDQSRDQGRPVERAALLSGDSRARRRQ